jgi:hypothetical protein
MLLQKGFFVVGVVLGSTFAASVANASSGSEGSPFVGTRLSQTSHNEEVRVRREIGAIAGYEDRIRATAVARMGGAEPAVVVKGRDGRWHALETTVPYDGGAWADNYLVRDIVPLPSLKPLEELKADRSKKRQWAAVFLGFREDEVKLIEDSSAREARFMANVNDRLSGTGLHGQELPPSADHKYFVMNRKTAIEIRLAGQKSPKDAGSTLFHEQVHRADYELTQVWAARYYKTPDDVMSRNPYFTKWLLKQPLPAADAIVVADILDEAPVSTEARAYVRTFLAATEAGAYDVAEREIMTLAETYGAGPHVLVSEGLRGEMDASYRALSKDGKKAFDATIAAVKKKHPKSWVGTLVRR